MFGRVSFVNEFRGVAFVDVNIIGLVLFLIIILFTVLCRGKMGVIVFFGRKVSISIFRDRCGFGLKSSFIVG